jgi:2-amino-4-hydroxy-6-hydroxymethyldihydropteridine diphosphokinase
LEEFVTVFLGLGSNLDGPESQIKRALVRIQELVPLRNFRCSSLVETPPLAGMNQPDYVNGVCGFETALGAEELLSRLRSIEDEQGRRREVHWGPRTLDLDILLYGRALVSSETLDIPHPGMEEREFVLVPLLQLEPDLTNLNGQAYADILADLYTKNPSQMRALTS